MVCFATSAAVADVCVNILCLRGGDSGKRELSELSLDFPLAVLSCGENVVIAPLQQFCVCRKKDVNGELAVKIGAVSVSRKTHSTAFSVQFHLSLVCVCVCVTYFLLKGRAA